MRSFRWVDGERTIHFGRGALAEAVEALGGPGYTLLTTERAQDGRAVVARPRARCTSCRAGHVDELAADLRGTVDRRPARRARRRARDRRHQGARRRPSGGRAMAVPTTLSGAEMTRVHRHARGVDESTPRVRPAVVVFDPALAASQPRAELAASSLNALGHAVEAPCMVRANPVATLAAHEAARLLRAGLGRARARPRHARARRAARRLRDRLHRPRAAPRARPDARARRRRRPRPGERGDAPAHDRRARLALPERIDALNAAVGEDLAELALRIRARTGAGGLADLGVDPAVLPDCADAAAARPAAATHARRPPTAPRSSLFTRARSDHSDYRGLDPAEPVDEPVQACHVLGEQDARSGLAAGGRGGRAAAHTAVAHPHARRGPGRRRRARASSTAATSRARSRAPPRSSSARSPADARRVARSPVAVACSPACLEARRLHEGPRRRRRPSAAASTPLVRVRARRDADRSRGKGALARVTYPYAACTAGVDRLRVPPATPRQGRVRAPGRSPTRPRPTASRPCCGGQVLRMNAEARVTAIRASHARIARGVRRRARLDAGDAAAGDFAAPTRRAARRSARRMRGGPAELHAADAGGWLVVPTATSSRPPRPAHQKPSS